jgi:hypothetical protein
MTALRRGSSKDDIPALKIDESASVGFIWRSSEHEQQQRRETVVRSTPKFEDSITIYQPSNETRQNRILRPRSQLADKHVVKYSIPHLETDSWDFDR